MGTQPEEVLGRYWWVWLWVICSVLATAAHYINMYFQRKAEERLLAEQKRYQSALRQASQGMTLIKELDRLLKVLVYFLTHKIRLTHAGIYLWDEGTKRFVLKATRQKSPEENPTLGIEDPLVQYIRKNRGALVTEELQLQIHPGQTVIRWVVESLKKIDAAVVVPSFVEEHCVGFLVLGDKLSGALYTTDDLQVLQVLANQAALAIENAQFYEELKATQANLFQTAKMASLGHMAGGMSHQINNRFHVLTILAGTLQANIKGTDPSVFNPEQLKEWWGRLADTLGKIEENALRGGDIVKTLLKFSRPAGEYKPVKLETIISTALEVVQFRVNLATLDLVKEIPPDLPAIKGDLNQLADSLFNLVSNAFDAMQKKAELIENKEMAPSPKDPTPFRGRLRMRGTALEADNRTWVILEVEDNGVGMSNADLQSLFIPFFTTKATAEKGTGLGLYIIQRILEQHGGTIQTSSAHGVGTKFTLKMPAYEEAHATV